MAHFYCPIARSLFGAPLLQFHFTANSAALLIEKSINEYYNMEECCDERYKVSGGAINGEWK